MREQYKVIINTSSLKMEGVVVVMYYDGDVVLTTEGLLFECLMVLSL